MVSTDLNSFESLIRQKNAARLFRIRIKIQHAAQFTYPGIPYVVIISNQYKNRRTAPLLDRLGRIARKLRKLIFEILRFPYIQHREIPKGNSHGTVVLLHLLRQGGIGIFDHDYHYVGEQKAFLISGKCLQYLLSVGSPPE